jgi:hypothetical protein
LLNFFRDLLQVLADHHPDSQVDSLELQALVEAHHPQVLVDSLLDSLLAGHLHQASLLPEDETCAYLGRKGIYDGLRKGWEIQAQFRRWGELGFTYRKLSLCSIDGATTQIKTYLMSNAKVPTESPFYTLEVSVWPNFYHGELNWRRKKTSLEKSEDKYFSTLHISHHSDQQRVKVLLHEFTWNYLAFLESLESREKPLLVEQKKGGVDTKEYSSSLT